RTGESLELADAVLNQRILDELVRRSQGLPLYIEFLLQDFRAGKFKLSEPEKWPRSLDHYFVELTKSLELSDEYGYRPQIATLLACAMEPLPKSLIFWMLAHWNGV